jgi:nucleotide-binding universal stress UspA family protein
VLEEEKGMAGSTIIVGIDDSPSSQAALSWAARLARATRWDLRAVHVLEWPVGLAEEAAGEPAEVVRLPDSAVDQAFRHGMRRVFDEVDPQSGWELHFAEGDTAPMLVRLAAEAELLVIGSREHDTSGRVLAGGISHFCISHATRPVVVVPVEYLSTT